MLTTTEVRTLLRQLPPDPYRVLVDADLAVTVLDPDGRVTYPRLVALPRDGTCRPGEGAIVNVSVPGCPVITFAGLDGRPNSCTGEPTHTAVIRWRQRRSWVRVFLCRVHAVDVPAAEPMTNAHRALLAARREDWRRGLAGLGYAGPPVSTSRDGV